MRIITFVYTLCLLAAVFPLSAGYVRFEPGYDYTYHYQARFTMGDVDDFDVESEITLRNIRETGNEQELLMTVHTFRFSPVHQPDVVGHDMDLRKWFSADITVQGEVGNIFYPVDEEDDVITLKKGLIAVMSGKFLPANQADHVDHARGNWSYSTSEIGHEGSHNATYRVSPTLTGRVFTKTRQGYKHPTQNVLSSMEKTVHIDDIIGTVKSVKVTENIQVHQDTAAGFEPHTGMRKVEPVNEFEDTYYPQMEVFSRAQLSFVRRSMSGKVSQKPAGLRTDTIHYTSQHQDGHMPDGRLKDVNITEAHHNMRNNLTCIREAPSEVSTDILDCFQHLVAILRHLPDRELETIAAFYLNGNNTASQSLIEDRSNVLDVLWATGTKQAEGLLARYVLLNADSDQYLLQRLLYHLTALKHTPHEDVFVFLEMVANYSEAELHTRYDKDIVHTILLALGAVSQNMRVIGHTDLALRYNTKLMDMLGVHDPWLYRQRRSSQSPEEQIEADLRNVILLEALGNGRHELSYQHILAHVNCTNSPWVKRSAIHALRYYHHQEVADVILEAAVDEDNEEEVRYEAMLEYQAHPYASPATTRSANSTHSTAPAEDTGEALQSRPPRDAVEHHTRHRRGILDKAFEFKIEPPGVDFRKLIGSKSIGASFGVIMSNLFDLRISALSGHIKVNVHDEVYARAHIGALGLNFDYFAGRICFKGGASYNLNIFQEYNPKQILETFKMIKDGIKDVVHSIKSGINTVSAILKMGSGLKRIVDDFLTAFRELPQKVLSLRQAASDAMENLGELMVENLPPFMSHVKELVDYVSNLFNDIKTDVMDFYYLLAQTIESIIPNAAKQIFVSVKGITKEFPNLIKDPKGAVARIGKGVVSIGMSIKQLKNTWKKIKDSAFIDGKKPYWMDVRGEYEKITDMSKEAYKSIKEEGTNWVDSIKDSEDPIATLTDGAVTEAQIRGAAIDKVKTIIEDLVSPFGDLQKLGLDFLERFNHLSDLVAGVKDGFNNIKLGFRKARAILDKIFGPKCHTDFPKLIRDLDPACSGSGFFPARLGSRDEYRMDGVDLEVAKGNDVVAPFSGVAVLTGHDNEVKIMHVTELPEGQEVIVMNVDPIYDIYNPNNGGYIEKRVAAGEVIGKATDSHCKNHIHFVLLGDGAVIDPSRLLAPRPPEKPEWKQQCDDYKLEMRGNTVAADVIVGIGGQKKSDTTEDLPDDGSAPDSVDDSESPSDVSGGDLYDHVNQASGRKKRGVIDAVKDKTMDAIDTLLERTAAFLDKFSIQKLKMGEIAEFLKKYKIDKSLDKLKAIINRIKEAIEDTPCRSPAQMTDEEIRVKLSNKGMVPAGTRDQMIKTLLTADNSCPLVAIGIPKVGSMYCSFDDSCLRMDCCLTLKIADILQKSYKAYIYFEPEDLALKMGFGTWQKSFNFSREFEAIEDTIATGIKLSLLSLEVICRYKIEKGTTEILASFGCGLCTSDDHSACVVFEYLVENAIIPIPTLDANGEFVWPDVDWEHYFSIDNVKKRFEDAVDDLIDAAKDKAVDVALEALGLPRDFLKSNARCPIPGSMTDAELVDELSTRALSTGGSRSQQEQRLRTDDLSCTAAVGTNVTFSDVDKAFQKIFYYQVSKQCMRLDACIDVQIPGTDIVKTFTAYLELDPCNFKLNVAIEKWHKELWLITHQWGKQSTLKLTNGVFLSYTIDKEDSAKEFIVSAALTFSAISFDLTFADRQRIPIPVCNAEFRLPGKGDLQTFADSLGGQLTQGAFDIFVETTGLEDILLTEKCVLPPNPKNCSIEVSDFIPESLSDIVHCKLLDNCWGVSCCVDFGFDIPFSASTMNVSIPFMFRYDPCEYFIEAKLGKKHYFKQWFVDYTWGKENVISLGKGETPPINIRYLVKKFEDSFTIDASMSICLPVGGDTICIPKDRPLYLLENEHVPKCFLGLDDIQGNYPDFSLGGWLEERGRNMTAEIGEAGRDYIYEKLNIKELMLKYSCDRKRAPYTPTVNGWNIACPKSHIRTLELPDWMACHVSADCTTISCCFDVPFIDIGVKVDLQLDLCNNIVMTSLEKAYSKVDKALANYEWGKTKVKKVGKVLTAKYKIEKPARDVYVVDLTITACFEKNGTCLVNTSFSGLEIPRVVCVDTNQTCMRADENVTHQCAIDVDCQGITCDVEVHDKLPVFTTNFYFSACTDELVYGVGGTKWTSVLSLISDGSKQMQQVDTNITMWYQVDASPTMFDLSVNYTMCGDYSHTNGCDVIEVLNNLPLRKGSCDKQSRKRRTVRSAQTSTIPDLETTLKQLIKRKATNAEITQLMEDIKALEEKGKEAVLAISELDEDDVSSAISSVKSLGVNNPLVIPNLRGSAYENTVTTVVKGGDTIRELLGDVKAAVGKAKQMFVVGKGLTAEGNRLFSNMVANLSIGGLGALLELNKVDPTVIHGLVLDMIDLATALYSEAIQIMTSGALENAFQTFELDVRGNIRFPGASAELFYYVYVFPVGPVAIVLEFGADFHFGIDFGVGVKVLNMIGEMTVTPYGGLKVWGRASFGAVLYAELELVGYIMELQFPTKAEIGFSKFPIDVAMSMDLNLVPLRLQLNGLVTLSIKIPFCCRIRKILFKARLWEYVTPSIRKNIFHLGKDEEDSSPPAFSDVAPGSKKKRAVSGSQHCLVEQLPERDYTEPAFQIEVAAVDDVSQVSFFLDVGTSPGGTDTLREFELGGALTKLSMNLKHTGVPLYFTMHGQNSQKTRASVTCELRSYDVTVPSGRVTADFTASSNPAILRAGVVAHDETELNITNVAIGYGESIYGDQLNPWHPVDLSEQDYTHQTVSNQEYNLVNFAGSVDGRLIGGVIQEYTKVQRVSHCAQKCLDLPGHSCLSFNYDYGVSGACQILKAIEGHDHIIAKDGLFGHFERLGIGNVVEVEDTDLTLKHNFLYKVNMEMRNALGYENIISSAAILIDFRTPDPGHIANAKNDYLEFVPCLDLIPEDRPDWKRFCIGVDKSIKNHRVVVDGEGSGTVFNGMEALQDQKYTRINNYISANWDGIHDNETGILGYTWSVGHEYCEDMVHPHVDPHRHLMSESQWTLKGQMYPIPAPYTRLPDGTYFITVRALNKVTFGGPLTISVCHTTPYIVDTSRPLVDEIYNIRYDERSFFIYADMNISDPHSGILHYDVCLGTTSRTCNLLPWFRYAYENAAYVSHRFQIPDGKPAWLRLRAVNNVLLSTVEAADQAIIVDSTPPIAGKVNDGPEYKTDLVFSKDSHQACVNWVDFYDPESGISGYLVGLGSSSGQTDIVPLQDVYYKEHTKCFDLASDKVLVHGNTYYAIVYGINGGIVKRNASAVSDGVEIDVTPPHEGSVIDGDDPSFTDLQFSPAKSSVALQWKGYGDDDSDIDEYSVQISSESGGSKVVLRDWTKFPKSSDRASWQNFHLKHNNYIKSTLRVTNGARNTIERQTNGFLVDLTAPEMAFIGDGSVNGVDLRYQDTADRLSANFDVSDKESGLDVLRFQILSSHNGLKKQIWPVSEEWHTGPNIDDKVFTKTDLTLESGVVYSVRVSARNKAGIIGIHETDGVIVDATAPEIDWLHVGVLFGEDEDIHAGYVYQSDHSGIKVSMSAYDHDSGVEKIKLSVGTSPGSADIFPVTEFTGDLRDVYISDIQLTDTDRGTSPMSPVYYVTLVAVNGAGRASSSVVSTPIAVVPEDVPGIVIDGITSDDNIFDFDIDYTHDLSTVSVTIAGLKTALHHVKAFSWAIGTAPDTEDVLTFTEYGLTLTETPTVDGVIYSGFGQVPVTLHHGQYYFATVRAVKNDGSVLSTVTDGFTVDRTHPDITIDSFSEVDSSVLDSSNTVYQIGPTFLQGEWHYSDSELVSPGILDNINSTWASLGTYPYGDDVYDRMVQQPSALYQGRVIDGSVTLLEAGLPNILSVGVMNKAGLTNTVYSPAIVLDSTAPAEGSVSCPPFAQPNVPIKCTWTPFIDDASPITSYTFSVGKTQGSSDVLSPVTLPGNITTHTATDLDVSPQHGHVYYATVTASNAVDLTSTAFSEAIYVDTTPPTAGVVIELSHEHVLGTGGSVVTDTSCLDASCIDRDAVCQESLTSISVAWQPFVDEESGISEYHLAIGTTHGGTDVKDYFQVEPFPSETSYTVQGLNLDGLTKIYVTVMAVNGAGISSVATSNGVYLSYLSQGLAPPTHIGVWDAIDGMQEDIDFQVDTTQLAAGWDVSGDPCPAVKYEWAIERIDGLVVQNYTEITGSTSSFNDRLNLANGETYYSLLRVTNALDYMYVLRSDGVTIHSQALAAGQVFDGDVFGYDLNVLPSRAVVTCNWEGFGVDITGVSVEDIINGNGADTASRLDKQEISHYEVGIGTDRRFSSTRANIVPFTAVGTNTSHTFRGLNLVPGTATYYCTVKAHSTSVSTAEVASNGFSVAFNGGVSAGSVKIPSFIVSDTMIEPQWLGFTSKEDIMLYYAAIATSTTANGMDCKQFVDGGQMADNERKALFDIQDVTNVGTNTFVSLAKLPLQQGSTYHVYVMALDFAGECNMTMATTTVDLTGPQGGGVTAGPYYNMPVTYSPDSTSITATWADYTDDVSAIKDYTVSLWYGGSCDDTNLKGQIGGGVILTADIQTFTFKELVLDKATPYFVRIVVQNGAGLTLTHTSSPILYDDTSPSAGHVVEGNKFTEDVVWWGSTSHVSGTILHYQNPTGKSCPSQNIAITDNQWASLDGKLFVHPDGRVWNLIYIPEHVKPDVTSGELTIQISKDSKSANMISGAYVIQADFEEGGVYQVDVRAASGDDQLVTEILLVDNGIDEIRTHHQPMVNLTEEFCSCCSNTSTGAVCACPDCDAYNRTVDGSSPLSQTTACGLQITTGTEPFGIVWCTFGDGQQPDMNVKTLFNFDPATSFHTYKMDFVKVKEDLLPTVCLYVYVDDAQFSYLCGIPEFGISTQFVLHVWNRDKFLPVIEHDLHTWTHYAIFRDIVFPPKAGELCRYGEPFRAGEIPIIRYEAGLGSTRGEVDILPFQEVLYPCSPCTDQCSLLDCDQGCTNDRVEQLIFSMDNLQLKSLADDNDTDSLITYYIAVKAVLGSGRFVTAYSNGFYVDVTEPVFDEDVMLYIDVDQGEYTPVEYQGSNSTIKSIWMCSDTESEIQEYQWSIGSTPGGDNVQPFISTGTNPSGIKTDLEGVLKQNATYYVSVKCTNEAGLTTTYQDQRGVRVLLEAPDAEQMKGHIENAEEFGYKVTPSDALKTEDPTSVGASWEVVDDPSIRRYEFCVGSSVKSIEDIFRCTWVGYNASASVKIENGFLMYNGERMYSLDEIRQDVHANSSQAGQFNMEPGRVLFISIRLCNEAAKCGTKHLGTVTVTGQYAKAGVADGHTPVTVTLRDSDTKRGRKRRSTDVAGYTSGTDTLSDSNDTRGRERRSTSITVSLTTPPGLPVGQTVQMSVLTAAEMSVNYTSSASNNFVSYITDPNVTLNNTDRWLRGRVESFETSFSVVSVGQLVMPGTMSITFSQINTNPSGIELVYMLVHWNPDAGEWQESSHTCVNEVDTEQHSIANGTTTVKVCDTRSSAQGAYFSAETQFAILTVTASLVNNPPVLNSSTTLEVDEDAGTFISQLTAYDPDGDAVGFRLLTTHPVNLADQFSLADNGSLLFVSCKHCFGDFTVDVELYDKPDYSEIAREVARATVVITVRSVNDPPNVFLVNNKVSILHPLVTDTLQIFRESFERGTIRVGVFGAYDYDTTDDLTVIYSNSTATAIGTFTVSTVQLTYEDTIPCNATQCFGRHSEVAPTSMRWEFAELDYNKDTSSSGEDTIRLAVKDSTGTLSDIVTVTVYTLEAPCLNGGICRPTSSYPCIDPIRVSNFDANYACVCPVGWKGNYCEHDVDECELSPCTGPTVCENSRGSYQCVYAVYFIVLVTLGCVAAVTLIVLAFLYIRKRNKRRQKTSDFKDFRPEVQPKAADRRPSTSLGRRQSDASLDFTLPNSATPRGWTSDLQDIDHMYQSDGDNDDTSAPSSRNWPLPPSSTMLHPPSSRRNSLGAVSISTPSGICLEPDDDTHGIDMRRMHPINTRRFPTRGRQTNAGIWPRSQPHDMTDSDDEDSPAFRWPEASSFDRNARLAFPKGCIRRGSLDPSHLPDIPADIEEIPADIEETEA